jgi:hypothetical protein
MTSAAVAKLTAIPLYKQPKIVSHDDFEVYLK